MTNTKKQPEDRLRQLYRGCCTFSVVTQAYIYRGSAPSAFLDDVYIAALPERIRALYDALTVPYGTARESASTPPRGQNSHLERRRGGAPTLEAAPSSLSGLVIGPTLTAMQRIWRPGTLPVIFLPVRQPHGRLLNALRGHGALPCAAAAVLGRQRLRDSGFDAPEWSTSSAPHPDAPGDRWPFKGWQRLAGPRLR